MGMTSSIFLAIDVQTWTYILVGITFSLYIGIAIWSRAGSTKEFYVAGGGVSPLANGMATAADWMSAASFISMAGIISFAGYDGAVYLMGWTGGYVLLTLLLAPYLRKFGKFTVPDFIGDRYYSNGARIVAVFCALLVSFTYVAGQMRGVGIVFSRFLEVDINTGVIIGMLIVLFYAVLGGMKGITYTQVAQYCVLIFAFMVPAIFISIQMTGNPIPQLGFGSELTDGSGTYLLDKLDGLSIGTLLGWSYGTEFDLAKENNRFFTKNGELEPNFYMLSKGRLDAVVHSELSAVYVLNKLGLKDKIFLGSEPLTLGNIYFAVKKGTKKELLDRINLKLKDPEHLKEINILIESYKK